MSLRIIGTGKSLPDFLLSNEKLSTMLDTSDEWIVSRTGIKYRHISTGETLSDLATKAAGEAISNAKVLPSEIDLIIATTIGGEYLTPSLACVIQKRIGAVCPAFDINAACTGFIYALNISKAYFDSAMAKKILIVSAEMMSSYVDWKDRSSCVLFGDGAGAVLLEKGSNLLEITISATGDEDLLKIGGMKGNNPFSTKQPENPYLKMNGKDVFKFAVSSMCNDIGLVLKKAGLTMNDIKKVIPHQANMRIINFAKEKLGIPDDKIVSAIDRFGNTSSASIPILIAELIENKELAIGDLVVLSAFGGGLTNGACIIRI